MNDHAVETTMDPTTRSLKQVTSTRPPDAVDLSPSSATTASNAAPFHSAQRRDALLDI